jgi:hypothetical protein
VCALGFEQVTRRWPILDIERFLQCIAQVLKEKVLARLSAELTMWFVFLDDDRKFNRDVGQ